MKYVHVHPQFYLEVLGWLKRRKESLSQSEGYAQQKELRCWEGYLPY